MEISDKIIQALPYGNNFRFVDSIERVDEDTIIGNYTYKEDLPFYHSHFQGNPIVPGVIIIETMGQIGMVCHLIYLSNDYSLSTLPLLSNLEAEFFCNANYNEPIKVIGRKIYFRRNILKSSIEMRKQDDTLIATLTANITLIPKQQ
jgi:3-hydroxyacyl-[acyl-carrier-protein] dehydratase